MTKNTPIILDRLEAALAQHNVKLKRTQLLQIAASSFGFANTHQFTAADDKGEFNVLPASYVGQETLEVEGEIRFFDIFREESGEPFLVSWDVIDKANARVNQWISGPSGKLYDLAACKNEIKQRYEIWEEKITRMTSMFSQYFEQDRDKNHDKANSHSDNPHVACGNCLWIGRESECNPIADVSERIMPGEIMPSGECPRCGAVAHATSPSSNNANNEGDAQRNIDPEVPVYLTNACCESCLDRPEILEALNLEYGSFEGEFYPLTAQEEIYIAEDVVTSSDGLMHALTGYSALYRGEKYIMPSIELPVDPQNEGMTFNLVKKTAENYAKAILPKVQALGGNVLIDTGMNHCVVIQILVPFTKVFEIDQRWYDTLQWLMVDPELPTVKMATEYRYESANFAVTTSWIGEGNEGDYNPEDPLDHPLMRFDVQHINSESSEWENISDGSYCTQVRAYAPANILNALPQYIAEYLEMEGSKSIKRRLETISWIDEKTIRQYLAYKAQSLIA